MREFGKTDFEAAQKRGETDLEAGREQTSRGGEGTHDSTQAWNRRLEAGDGRPTEQTSLGREAHD